MYSVYTIQMPYMCEYCGRTFIYQSKLVQHQTRKISCKRICDRCGYQFARPQHLKVHLQKPTPCEKRTHKLTINGDNKGVIINGDIKNSYNTNITINVFGHENREFLTKDTIEEIADYAALPVILFQKKNFNPKHPENHNIMMINKREKEVMVKRKSGWVREPLERAHRDILNEQEYDIDVFYKDRPKQDDKKDKNLSYILWLLEDYMNSECGKEHTDVEIWLKKIDTLIINNKGMVMDSLKKEREAIKTVLQETKNKLKTLR